MFWFRKDLVISNQTRPRKKMKSLSRKHSLGITQTSLQMFTLIKRKTHIFRGNTLWGCKSLKISKQQRNISAAEEWASPSCTMKKVRLFHVDIKFKKCLMYFILFLTNVTKTFARSSLSCVLRIPAILVKCNKGVVSSFLIRTWRLSKQEEVLLEILSLSESSLDQKTKIKHNFQSQKGNWR